MKKFSPNIKVQQGAKKKLTGNIWCLNDSMLPALTIVRKEKQLLTLSSLEHFVVQVPTTPVRCIIQTHYIFYSHAQVLEATWQSW